METIYYSVLGFLLFIVLSIGVLATHNTIRAEQQTELPQGVETFVHNNHRCYIVDRTDIRWAKEGSNRVIGISCI